MKKQIIIKRKNIVEMGDLRFYVNVLCLLFSISFFSCSDKDDKIDPEVKVNKELFTFPKEGGEETLYVQTAADTQVSSDQSWCVPTEQHSASATMRKYLIAVSANPDTDSRRAQILVVSGGDSFKVVVEQAADSKLQLHSREIEVSGDGEIITTEISTSGTYQISNNFDSWIHHLESKAVNTSSERFVIDKNQMPEERLGYVVFTLDNLTDTLRIRQLGSGIPAPDQTGMESDAKVLAAKMFMGWNLGNTLEAPKSELAWGNPYTTKAMIDVVKASGFNAVRIPCAWDSYLEDGPAYKIKESWLGRVKEVVNYCIDNDMYALINIHWDGGWLENNCTADKQESVNEKQRILWTQIASYFRDYDEHLLFAGCNEPNVKTAAQMAVLKSYEQTFIDAVRATGGRNTYRNLIIQGPNTDIDVTDELMEMPTDPVSNRLMMEVHYYSPWLFCILENDDESGNKMQYFWGKDYEQYAAGKYAGRWDGRWGEEYVKSQFAKMKSRYADKGIPVILGEFGAVRRNLPETSVQQAHDESRAYFFEYIMEQSKNYGLVPFFWDNGGTNAPLFDRKNNMLPNSMLLDAMVRGASAGKYPY